MAQVKCQYCLEKLDKKEADFIETGIKTKIKKYYHKTCLNFKMDKDKAVELFYKYTGSLVLQNQVYLAFKKCRDKGLTDSDILYTMNYIIKNKHVLNYPMGILHYLDRAMKDKKEIEKLSKINDKILNSDIKILPLYMKKENRERDDSHDISDLI